MIELIISGVGLGIVLSFVAGPVFFALIKTSIEKGFSSGVALASGVVVSDAIYVAISLYGTSFINFENKYRVFIGIAGSLILFIIGFYYLLKKVKICYEKTTKKGHHTGYFFKGFFMCIFNPTILLYWISVTGGIVSVRGTFKPAEMIPFFATILITLYSMDILKAYFANKLRYKIKEKTLLTLNRVAGALIIVFACKLVYNLLFTQTLI